MRRLAGLFVVVVPVALFAAGCGGGDAGSGKVKEVDKSKSEQMIKQHATMMQGVKGAPKAMQTPGSK